jgi:hypothetical protein
MHLSVSVAPTVGASIFSELAGARGVDHRVHRHGAGVLHALFQQLLGEGWYWTFGSRAHELGCLRYAYSNVILSQRRRIWFIAYSSEILRWPVRMTTMTGNHFGAELKKSTGYGFNSPPGAARVLFSTSARDWN